MAVAAAEVARCPPHFLTICPLNDPANSAVYFCYRLPANSPVCLPEEAHLQWEVLEAAPKAPGGLPMALPRKLRHHR